ncbi:MAG: tRNA pseudouridine(38-40) synthase TruA [Lutibacter sp.]
MRYFIKLAYKGTNYHGWQYQPNAITVQELINKALSTVLKERIEILGAGRTDAGVHASEFYAHFDINIDFDKKIILYKANSILPDDIVLYNIFKVKPDLHARFDALKRSYEYRIFLGRNPFLNETTWQLNNRKFNVDLMNNAAKILFNYTNFKSFSRSNTDVKTYNCKIHQAEWRLNNLNLVFYISADRFLRNMVRAVVGTLLDVGLEKISISEFEKIIQKENRNLAGASAPARGLFLTKITYPKNSINE